MDRTDSTLWETCWCSLHLISRTPLRPVLDLRAVISPPGGQGDGGGRCGGGLLQTDQPLPDRPGAPPSRYRGRDRFSWLCAYGHGGRPVLRRTVRWRIPRASSVALTAASGAGNPTLSDLPCALRTPRAVTVLRRPETGARVHAETKPSQLLRLHPDRRPFCPGGSIAETSQSPRAAEDPPGRDRRPAALAAANDFMRGPAGRATTRSLPNAAHPVARPSRQRLTLTRACPDRKSLRSSCYDDPTVGLDPTRRWSRPRSAARAGPHDA